MKTEKFTLSGLHCPSCVRLVQEDAAKVDGVESAVVHLAEQELSLVYDENVFQFDRLEAVIKAAGFGVSR
jgi:copper chaperone CopZ